MTETFKNELEQFVTDEIADGNSFEDILEIFDLTPEKVFVHLFLTGWIDEEILETYLLDV